MKLAIDIGNSFSHFAVYNEKKRIFITKCDSKSIKDFKNILKNISYNFNITSIGISSVNHNFLRISNDIVTKLFKLKPLIINFKSKLPISIKIKSVNTLGADRICNAVYGHTYYQGKENVLIVDLGTANTYDIVTKKGEFIGGIIAPGIMTSSKALNINTANLPLLEYKNLSKGAPLIGKNTFEAIQSGLVNYMKFATEGIVQKAKKQFKGNLKVILTGGSAELLVRKLNFKYIYVQNTVLDAINIILNYQNTAK